MPTRGNAAKIQTLRQHGVLNPHPEAVTDPLFQTADFFDPQDLLQVKYEMLRRVEVDKAPVTEAAAAFGLSRPAFYQAQHAVAQQGLAGLIPRKRGPHGAHKLTPAVLEFVLQQRAASPSLTIAELITRIQQQFGVAVHRRTDRTAFGPAGKKTPLNIANTDAPFAGPISPLSTSSCAGACSTVAEVFPDVLVFQRQGMKNWIESCRARLPTICSLFAHRIGRASRGSSAASSCI